MCLKMVDSCPKCGDVSRIKAGHLRGRQRYKCKGCGFYYSVAFKSDVRPAATRRLALELYLEGLGFRAIGRILKVSNVTVLKWIRAFGEAAQELQSPKAVEVMEVDELHTYVGNKKTTNGYGLLLIDIEKGSSILCVGTEGIERATD